MTVKNCLKITLLVLPLAFSVNSAQAGIGLMKCAKAFRVLTQRAELTLLKEAGFEIVQNRKEAAPFLFFRSQTPPYFSPEQEDEFTAWYSKALPSVGLDTLKEERSYLGHELENFSREHARYLKREGLSAPPEGRMPVTLAHEYKIIFLRNNVHTQLYITIPANDESLFHLEILNKIKYALMDIPVEVLSKIEGIVVNPYPDAKEMVVYASTRTALDEKSIFLDLFPPFISLDEAKLTRILLNEISSAMAKMYHENTDIQIRWIEAIRADGGAIAGHGISSKEDFVETVTQYLSTLGTTNLLESSALRAVYPYRFQILDEIFGEKQSTSILE